MSSESGSSQGLTQQLPSDSEAARSDFMGG